MQYPIIDLITDAYLNNGWYGLENKNLLSSVELGTYNETLSVGTTYSEIKVYSSRRIRTANLIKIRNSFTISGNMLQASIIFFDSNKLYMGNSLYINWRPLPTTIQMPNNAEYIGIAFRYPVDRTMSVDDIANNNIMVEEGNTASSYVPPNKINDAVSYRLKLPLPHYFPHPVIDALISAADGQHTEEEKEILRHYLTPLGIGGI